MLSEARTTVPEPVGTLTNCDAHEQTMLVDNVKLVEFPQAVIPSTVRLESVYSLFSLLGHSLCFSDRYGSVFLQTLADRETGFCSGGVSVSQNQTVGEVVQGGSEAMSSISGKQWDVNRYRLELVEEITVEPCST
jgi:hypothetical protein